MKLSFEQKVILAAFVACFVVTTAAYMFWLAPYLEQRWALHTNRIVVVLVASLYNAWHTWRVIAGTHPILARNKRQG